MKKIIGLIILALVLMVLYAAWKVFGSTVKNPSEKYLYIPMGATYGQVKDSLRTNGYVTGFFWFDQVANYAKLPKYIKPGKYKVGDDVSIYQLIKKLRSGRQEPLDLVITKLRTKEDLARKIGRIFELDSLAAIHFMDNSDSLLAYNVDTQSVLTTVIPNTYRYLWTSDMHTIFKKLFREEEKFWNEERKQKAERLQLSPKEVYILASIVEEETNKASDKGKIASVYLNRLHKGMRLAADPTVKFAMRDFALKRIYHKHLDFSSPYNTYLNNGLPPGPICTPSIKTIDAVLNAPETEYLFFVAKPDFSGYSNFSVTYREHQIYARAYQRALDSLLSKEKETNN